MSALLDATPPERLVPEGIDQKGVDREGVKFDPVGVVKMVGVVNPAESWARHALRPHTRSSPT